MAKLESPLELFKHVYIDHGLTRTIVLLHGTGGNEYDLIPLVRDVGSQYNFLSLRGNVVEQGMNRFFARDETGVFDQESIAEESQKLSEFLKAWYQANLHASQQIVFLGYSNGANMILATMFTQPELFSRILLLHAKLPFAPGKLNLGHVTALVTLGKNDLLIPSAESYAVAQTLQELGAQVSLVEHEGGHEIAPSEHAAIQQFLLSA